MMFINRLLNQGNSPVLEQVMRFTEARQRLLADNVANATTPGYKQKDLSVDRFQKLLAAKVEERPADAPGTTDFASVSSEVEKAVESPRGGILFHDGNNRSMEQLMSDNAKNVLLHNFVVELLRKQYATMDMAIKTRVG